MPDYDFHSLSPFDFEILTRDLLQKAFARHIESFKSGPDQGIDLRFAELDGSTAIVQCKHYAKTGLSGLKRTLRKEVEKIKTLTPSRYILSTSVSLTRNNKKEILEILSPFCKSESDIFGAECLNNLLGKHKEIERQHFKLWIASTNVLQKVLNNDIFTRSYLDEESIRKRLALFVRTPAIDRALKHLEEFGFCLIVGIPGIGKTTAAEILVSIYLVNQWNCLSISDTREALKCYGPDEKQLIYFDDFLGQTKFTEKLLKNEDRDLVRLIKACSENKKSKRLILTTREYILAQAKESYETLNRLDIDIAKCTIDLANYDKKTRAEILVNHLYFYDVSKEICRDIVNSGIALQIVEHANYNPRVIEAICDKFNNSESKGRFGEDFLKALENPSEIWQHVFENQLSPIARELLICFATIGGVVELQSLQRAFLRFRTCDEISTGGFSNFQKALKELNGNFIDIFSDDQNARQIVQFQNPSIKDFTDNFFQGNAAVANHTILNAEFHCQLTFASELAGISSRNLVHSAIELLLQQDPHQYKIGGSWAKSLHLPSERLLYWLKHKQVSDSTHVGLIAKHAAEYLCSTPKRESPHYLVRLYDEILEISADAISISNYDFAYYLIAEANDVLDFEEIDRFIGQDERFEQDVQEEFRDELAGRFEGFAADRLGDLIADAQHSSELCREIEEIEGMARQLGCYSDDIEVIQDAKKKAAGLAEYEDAQADFQQEFWMERRDEEIADSNEISEILKSLLD